MECVLAAVTDAARGSTARHIFTLVQTPLIAGMVLYAVGAEEAVDHASGHLESVGRTSLPLGVGLVVCAHVFLAHRSDHFITWERLAAAAIAIGAVLGLQT